jgi:hypothetical protein
MTDAIQTALIVAIPPTLVGIAAIITSLRNRAVAKAEIREVHLLINSRMTQFLELAKSAAFAEGEKAEKDKPRDSTS